MVPVLCLKNTFSPSPDDGWGGGSKNRRHPSLLHVDPIYRPAWQGPVGLLAHSWIPAGEGEGCWAASHVRWDPGATTLLLDTDFCLLVLACFLVPSLVPVHSRQHLPTWLSLPPLSCPQKGVPLVPGDSVLSSRFEVQRGYGFSATSPRALSLIFTRGKGCVCQKQQYKYGAGTPPESLGQFANDSDQRCILILEPLVVSPEIRQGLGYRVESAGGAR